MRDKVERARSLPVIVLLAGISLVALALLVPGVGVSLQLLANTASGAAAAGDGGADRLAHTLLEGRVIKLQRRYLEGIRDSLTGVHLETPSVIPGFHSNDSELEHKPFSRAFRDRGTDWPLYGLSMAGSARLNNVWELLEDVIANNVLGSFTECGVWRGGASIFAKAVFTAHDADREVHLVDSFEGLPPNTTSEDNSAWHAMSYLRVSREQVQAGFERYNLLDSRVFFHKGYFISSLPTWKQEGTMGPIAVLRMDGDMYESTMDQLYNLYDAVSPGGYIIIDDYNIGVCKKAIKEFFHRHGLSYKIKQIDDYGAYFQKGHKNDPKPAPIDQSWYLKFNTSRQIIADS